MDNTDQEIDYELLNTAALDLYKQMQKEPTGVLLSILAKEYAELSILKILAQFILDEILK